MVTSATPELGQQPAPALVVVFAEVDERFLRSSPSSALADTAEVLSSERVELVLCSSMTRAQIELLEQELGIQAPFICESGAAVIIPETYFSFNVPSNRHRPGYHVIEFGRPYAEIVLRLHQIAHRLATPVVGFSDQTVEQVAQTQELSLSHARLAKLREYDEPFRLRHPTRNAYQDLWRSLRGAGLVCTSFGSPEHVGAPVDKAAAIDMVSTFYRREFKDVITVGWGTDNARQEFSHARHAARATVAADLPSCVDRSSESLPEMDRALWLTTIIDIAARARFRHHAPAGRRHLT